MYNIFFVYFWVIASGLHNGPGWYSLLSVTFQPPPERFPDISYRILFVPRRFAHYASLILTLT